MSNFIERYEASLVEAHARANPRTRSRRIVPIAAALTAGLAIGIPAAATTAGWNPFNDADRGSDTPTTTHTPPARSLRDALGVLRRPQTDADRSPSVEAAVKTFDRDVQRVQLPGIRSLTGGAVLVPVGEISPVGPGGREATPRPDSVCLYAPSESFPASSCFQLSQIRSGQAVLIQGDVVAGLVPDGVAAVQLTDARGARVTTDVHDNYYSVLFPEAAAGTEPRLAEVARTTWLNAASDVVAPANP